MPANPDDGARLAARILELIAAAERALIALVVGRLRNGITSARWEYAKLAEVQLLRKQLLTGAQRLNQAIEVRVDAILLEAYNQGQALAVRDLEDAAQAWTTSPHAEFVALDLARTATSTIKQAVDQVPDVLIDIYRDAVRAGVEDVLSGRFTRQQGAQRVLDELGTRGITGFRDAAGRNWSLESYAEMSVRTGAGHAAVQGHVDTLAASGLDLIIVSDAPRECPVCRPWERQILSIGGRVGAVIEPSAISDRGVIVNVKGSLADARAAGFQHPNCRHSVSVYLPGVTVKGTAQADPARYEAGQRQREIERNIRAWKRRQVVALDDVAAKRAAAKVREWQGTLRAHLDEHDLTRLRRREQIGRAI